MLLPKILWYFLALTVSVDGYALSKAIEHSALIEPSISPSSSDLSKIAVSELRMTGLHDTASRTCGLHCYETHNISPRSTGAALVVRNIKTIKKQTTTSSDPCGSNPCSSSTTSSAPCSSSDPCPKDTTETETHLATITLQTTEMQTAYITDHITTTQRSTRMFTKIVNVAETVTSTSTVTGCSTFTTVVTTVGSTTTITNVHPAPTSTSSGCGSASCTVTTSVFTDKDVPTSTTSAGTAEASGHEVVEVISEEKMEELMAKKKKEKKEDIADKELRPNGAGKNAVKLVARQSIESGGAFSLAGGLAKKASVTAVTSPSVGTTDVTIKLPLISFTVTMTTTQAAYLEGKAGSGGSELVDYAVSTARTAHLRAPPNAPKLVARQDSVLDSESSATGGFTKEADVDAVTPPVLGTTLMTMTLRVPRETETIDTKTIEQFPSFSAGKPRFEGPEAGMGDRAASTALTARSSLPCITLRSQGAHSTICPHSSCWTGDC